MLGLEFGVEDGMDGGMVDIVPIFGPNGNLGL